MEDLSKLKEINKENLNKDEDIKSLSKLSDDPMIQDLTNNESQNEKEFKFSDEPTFEKLRSIQNRFVNERNWGQFQTPRNLLLALVNEVGELAEVFQWKGEVPSGLPGWSQTERESLEHELSDVLIYLLRLAEVCHVDLPVAASAKIELNKRKYPVDKFYGSNKKYDQN